MAYIMAILLIIITVCCRISGYAYDSGVHFQEYTRPIILKQGILQGVVMAFTKNRKPFVVEQYRGIPYAAPPVGELRFMPSGSAPSWFGTKFADTFGPVCPQRFPDVRTMTPDRRERFLKLREMLLNESEDCLYLNIYTPHQENPRSARKYPVMIYIHGESFEWNSGNPYDGSVLAAYGNVIVVTLNYRLGVLGFLKAGTEEHSKSNFGLVDQIAALLWVKENIAAFGGDPNTVTLFGHGTGAVCASLLMLSPMIVHEGNKMLFQRAILMSGSALSDWALASNPQGVSYQVAQALNCQIQDDFAACLRRKRLEEIMAAPAITPAYRTRFGPVIDSIVIPNDPKKSMTTYNNIFKRFELLYGITELESIHLLSPEALKLGMLEKDRDQELRKYLRFRCEMKSELCVTRTLAEYLDTDFTLNDEKYGGYTGHEPDRASLARDALLDILSDARTVAPIVQMAKYHAAVNLQSYFYVFTHKTNTKEYLNNKSYNGEELPYVFGVPLGGFNQHLAGNYNDNERLLSEKIMTYFSNFAYTGDPNMPRRNEYRTLGPEQWLQFDVDWPEYDLSEERYLQLGIPPYVSSHYREKEMIYWNEIFPELSFNQSYSELPIKPKKTVSSFPPKSRPPWILAHDFNRSPINNKYENFNKPLKEERIYGVVKSRVTSAPDNMIHHQKEYGTIIYGPQSETATNKDLSTTITIALGSVFLFLNICVFLMFYVRRYRKRKLRNVVVEKVDETNNENPGNSTGCNIVKIVRQSTRSDDVYEAVKAGSSQEKLKLPRQMSSSTIDAHTKVRDWITNEIIYKYSPRILRRPREPDLNKDVKQEAVETGPLNDNNSTLGRSPTRPASPCENFRTARPPLIKSSSIPVQKTKRPEKVSVAIDATPSGRGASVLQQQPIELTKSLDRPNFEQPLRRSLTLDDFSNIVNDNKQELRKSTTNINLKIPSFDEPTVIRIEHSHSKSDPVQDSCSSGVRIKKLKTFDPNCDVNVTSRDENIQTAPLTPEESLMIIKRRNFPKVLPDYPSKEALAKKRRSVPVANHLFKPIPENSQQTNSSLNRMLTKYPPEPPRRTTSTLTRKPANNAQPVCQSAPMLAVEPPASPEPEVACNNLYVGPLIPKLTKTELSNSDNSKLNTNPIYDSLRNVTEQKRDVKPMATTIVTADPNQPIKRLEPKIIIKPAVAKSCSDTKKNIPRVVVNDNLPNVGGDKTCKASHIPTLVVKNTKESSSESSPSEESDTGTVVKRL